MAASLAEEYNDEANGDRKPRVDKALNSSKVANIVELLRIRIRGP